jgi:two-component system, OmpR family, response regulator
MRVLLVEDDSDLSSRLAASLRTESFVVDIARNGEDAQHAGLTETFDVAVLDLGLPKIDGVSVLRAWREADRSFPVLVLTARDGWPDKVASFKAGADDYLTKPFKVEELVLRLRRACEARQRPCKRPGQLWSDNIRRAAGHVRA